jgi:hypothetical protein
MASAAADIPRSRSGRGRHPATMAVLALCFATGSTVVLECREDDASLWFTRVGFTPAYIFAANPFSLDDTSPDHRIRATPSMTFEIGRQTDGTGDWHHLYGLPSYGFGFSIASLGTPDRISRPMDVYTFFSWPFARLTEKVQLTSDFGMGVSWNWKAFHEERRTYTTVLGSNVNARIDWGFYLRYAVTPNTSLYTGLDFTHRSNGGMRQTNQGINVIGPSVALRRNLTHERSPSAVPEIAPFQPAWELVVSGTGGIKSLPDASRPAGGRTVGVVNVGAGLQRHFYRYGKLAAGSEVTYKGAGQMNGLGVYGGYEHQIGRFAPLVQLGYVVAHTSEITGRPRRYGRLGWRYHFNDRYWATVAVRSIKSRHADFVEFGIGYKKRW